MRRCDRANASFPGLFWSFYEVFRRFVPGFPEMVETGIQYTRVVICSQQDHSYLIILYGFQWNNVSPFDSNSETNCDNFLFRTNFVILEEAFLFFQLFNR